MSKEKAIHGEGASGDPSYWLALKRAADMAGLSVRQVSQLVQEGRLEGRQIGAAFHVSRSSLMAHLGRSGLKIEFRIDESAAPSDLASALASLLLSRARAALGITH